MDHKSRKLILASASPRRRELLQGADLQFTVDADTDFIESYAPDTPAEDIPALMSEGKSYGFHRQLEENEILLTSDTMVICDGKAMGKPHDRQEAVEMLEFLSGKCHSVVTAITLRDSVHSETVSDKACVHFKTLTPAEIEYYVEIPCLCQGRSIRHPGMDRLYRNIEDRRLFLHYYGTPDTSCVSGTCEIH